MMKRRSEEITGRKGTEKWVERTAARTMLRAVRFSDADFDKPLIALAVPYTNGTPCNDHIRALGDIVQQAIEAAGGKAIVFGTPVVSDGISMGSEAMKYSLVSREVIADSIELMTEGYRVDAVITLSGCDKTIPAALMPIARNNLVGLTLYGGSILPGEYRGQALNIVSAFEAIGAHCAGRIDAEELHAIECRACPGAGACGGMYTANTMASAIEALGMSLPNYSAQEAVSQTKNDDSRAAGEAVLKLLELDLKPSDIMTRKAFENAITVVITLGGSTNAVLHLLAMASTIGVELDLEDFTEIGKRVPVLADLRPSGHYMMSELVAIGGIQPLMKMLLERGLLHGDCLTVTGRTLAENLADVEPYPEGQDIIHAFGDPIKADSHLRILYGNLAPTGAVAKITGKEGTHFTGRARVFHSEEEAQARILDGTVVAGDVLVIRYEGPKGGPGMREMLSPTSAIMGKGLGSDVALITDGRFSGGSHGFVVGHITPEAAEGGPIALVEDGDTVTIDAVSNRIELDVSEAEMERRRQAWRAPAPRVTRGVLAKYARTVTSASKGAVTDLP